MATARKYFRSDGTAIIESRRADGTAISDRYIGEDLTASYDGHQIVIIGRYPDSPLLSMKPNTFRRLMRCRDEIERLISEVAPAKVWVD